MKRVAEFLRTTLIGGLLVVLPIYVSVLLTAKAVAGLLAVVAPITSQIPAGVRLRGLAAVAIIVVACFIAGLVVRTALGLRVKNALERSLLERIPGYSLVRGLAGRITGTSEDA